MAETQPQYTEQYAEQAPLSELLRLLAPRDRIPIPRPRPADAPLPPGMAYPSGPFSPQGNTGGGVNMPGLLASGAPASLRSEGTEYERAARELRQNRPLSLIGSMINPNHASLIDAIRAGVLRRQQGTGYSPAQPPGVGFGSLMPRGGQ